MTPLRLLESGAFAAAPLPRWASVPPIRQLGHFRPAATTAASVHYGGSVLGGGEEATRFLSGERRLSSGRSGDAFPSGPAGGASFRLGSGSDRPRRRRGLLLSRGTSTRLFGSKPGMEGGQEGEIDVIDNSETPPPPGCPPLSIPSLSATLSDLRSIIGYPTYDVTLVLTDDEEMRETNLETRGVDAPTDVLSFPFQECKLDGEGRAVPGSLEEPEFDMPEYYTLGDLMVDVPYVHRRIEEDRRDNQGGDGEEEKGAISELGDGDYSDVLADVDRGVSAAMSTEYDPQRRIEMLLVHGMLHLVGYDHIEDNDYEVMVSREEEVLVELDEMRRKRGGEEHRGADLN